jgi:4'-phosphopantetheinyl transferase
MITLTGDYAIVSAKITHKIMRIIYYKLSPGQISQTQEVHWLAELPVVKQQQIQRLPNRSDRLASLIGLQLTKLAAGLSGVDDFMLQEIRFDLRSKPRSPLPVDFSISHSGDLVACAFSTDCRVGLDVEKIRPVHERLYRRYCNAEEQRRIRQDKDVFFDFWTMRESVLKAVGASLFEDIANIRIDDETATLHETTWQLNMLALEPDYRACLATDCVAPDMIIEQLNTLE